MNVPHVLDRLGHLEYTFVYQPGNLNGWSIYLGGHEYHGPTIESVINQLWRKHHEDAG